MPTRTFCAAVFYSRYFFLWLVGVNLASFFLMGADKHKAERGAWRISERALLLPALLFGALGATLGMQTFRHKTKHWYFRYGLPAMLLLQLALAVWLIWF